MTEPSCAGRDTNISWLSRASFFARNPRTCRVASPANQSQTTWPEARTDVQGAPEMDEARKSTRDAAGLLLRGDGAADAMSDLTLPSERDRSVAGRAGRQAPDTRSRSDPEATGGSNRHRSASAPVESSTRWLAESNARSSETALPGGAPALLGPRNAVAPHEKVAPSARSFALVTIGELRYQRTGSPFWVSTVSAGRMCLQGRAASSWAAREMIVVSLLGGPAS